MSVLIPFEVADIYRAGREAIKAVLELSGTPAEFEALIYIVGRIPIRGIRVTSRLRLSRPCRPFEILRGSPTLQVAGSTPRLQIMGSVSEGARHTGRGMELRQRDCRS